MLLTHQKGLSSDFDGGASELGAPFMMTVGVSLVTKSVVTDVMLPGKFNDACKH